MESNAHNGSLDEIVEEICSDDRLLHFRELLHASLAPACLIYWILAFLEKRKEKCLNCCDGRPAFVTSVNLLDDFEHRWSYACAFGALTNTIVFLFTGGQYMDFVGPTWSKVFVGLMASWEVCIVYYPFFACLSTEHQLVGSIMGFLYAGFWFTAHFFATVICADPLPYLVPYITVVVQMPTLICLGFLVGKFLRIMVTRLNTVQHSADKPIKTRIALDFQIAYVKDVLKKEVEDLEEARENCCKKRCRRFVYINNPFFKYSTRIICAIVVVFCCTYQLGVFYYWLSAIWIDWMVTQADAILNATEIEDNSTVYENVHLALRLMDGSLDLITLISLALFSVDILAIVITYRKNLLELYKGDKHFLPRTLSLKSAEIVRYCMMFGGYQIAYMLWGYFLLNFVMWVLCLLLIFLIIIPLVNGNADFVIWLAEVLVIPLIISALLKLSQTLLAKLLLLEDKINSEDDDKPLAITNRKVYHLSNYFFFIANIEVGLFSCVYRIIKSFLFGMMFLGRMDRCVLMRDFEQLDKGFMAYLGMLLMENSHNNPSLRVFCQLLVDTIPPCQHQQGSPGHVQKDGTVWYNSSDSSGDGDVELGAVTYRQNGKHPDGLANGEVRYRHSAPVDSAHLEDVVSVTQRPQSDPTCGSKHMYRNKLGVQEEFTITTKLRDIDTEQEGRQQSHIPQDNTECQQSSDSGHMAKQAAAEEQEQAADTRQSDDVDSETLHSSAEDKEDEDEDDLSAGGDDDGDDNVEEEEAVENIHTESPATHVHVPGIARRRWHLAYTLINNPSLCGDRRHGKTEELTSVNHLHHIRNWYRKAKAKLKTKKSKKQQAEAVEDEETEAEIWRELEQFLFAKGSLLSLYTKEMQKMPGGIDRDADDLEEPSTNVDTILQDAMLFSLRRSKEQSDSQRCLLPEGEEAETQGDVNASLQVHRNASEDPSPGDTSNRRTRVTTLSSQSQSSLCPVSGDEVVSTSTYPRDMNDCDEITKC